MTEPAHLTAVRESYDLVAENYAELLRDELARKPIDRAVLGVLAELVGTARIGDLGCGPGRVSAYLHALGCEVLGVDVSPAMIAVARRSYPGIPFEVGTLDALPIHDGALGGIVAWYSIIHTPAELLPALFAEFARVLDPGGHLLLAFQVGDEAVHLRHGYGHDVSLTAYRLSPDRITRLLTGAGFTVTSRTVRAPGELEKTPQAYLLAHLA